MGKLSGILGGIKDADAYGAGKYILPGTHKFEVVNITIDPGKKNKSTYWFHAEMKVLETSNSDMKVGELRTYTVKIPPGSPDDNEKKMAFSNMKNYVMGLDPSLTAEEIDEDVFEQLTDVNQPAKGEVICCEAWQVDNVTKPGQFTKTRWYSPNSEVEED